MDSHSIVEEPPAQCTETALSANSSYSYGDQFFEFLVETRSQVAELGLVGDSASSIGFTLQ